MSTQPPGPTLKITDDISCSAHQIEDGPLIPVVLVPLVTSWSETEVVISDGEQERTLPVGPLTGPVDPDAEWEAAPAWGTIQRILWKQIRLDGAPHACTSCEGVGPWFVEWVTGAIEATGTAECRVCWHRDHSSWALTTIRVMAEQYRGEQGDFDADPPRRPSGTPAPRSGPPYRLYIDDDKWQEPFQASDS